MSYCAYVTTIKELRKHSNADRLMVATVFGNDVVVGLNMSVGDKIVYFPTDGKLNYDFAKVNGLLREKDANGNQIGGYMDAEKRNITSIRLRGEKSDGLIMPIDSLKEFTDIDKLGEGDTISTIGKVVICEKYVPRGKKTQNNEPKGSKTRYKPKESYPFFEQHIDTSQLVYNTGKFKVGDICTMTLKLHGTSQRTAYTIKKMESVLARVLNKVGFKFKPKKIWNLVSGTRRVTLVNTHGGYYGDNAFRMNWHDFFDGKLHKGEEVFYEVVGYAGDSLIMPECDNKKTKDKEFIKQYGEKTRFTYGCGQGQNDIHVYRMTITNEDGHVVEYSTELTKLRCEQMGVKFVPVLDKFVFTTPEDLLERVKLHENGLDPIGKTHVREGVIVRIEDKEKFTAFKHKNFDFKVLEGIIKADDVLDMEEEASEEN